MRRRLLASTAVAALGSLASAAGALAGGGGNAGFAPVAPHSPNASRITDGYWVIFGFTAFIFVLVTGSLVYLVVRYRRRGRPREEEGLQTHGNTRLELAWTALPVAILTLIGAFIFYKLPGIKNPPSARAQPNQLQVRVDAHRFYWRFVYPNGVVTIDRLRAPADTVVRLEVVTPDDDVAHSWWIPALNGKVDAIPGRVNHTWFQTSDVGTYRGQCAEFCGIQHAAMIAYVDVVPRADFASWLDEQSGAQRANASDLGAQAFTGACGKCHGALGQGDIGPRLVGNPILEDRKGLETLIREGRGTMPPIAQDWTDGEVEAFFKYVSTKLAQAPSTGSTGGNQPTGEGQQSGG